MLADAVAFPSLLPQVALELEMLIAIAAGSVIVTVAVLEHPFTSTTVTVYVPAINPVAAAVVCAGAVVHE